MRDFNCSVCTLPDMVSLTSEILPHKAVVGQTGKISNVGDFVEVICAVRKHNYI